MFLRDFWIAQAGEDLMKDVIHKAFVIFLIEFALEIWLMVQDSWQMCCFY